jgi:hypothetical protein
MPLAVVDFTTCQKMVLALGNWGPDDLSWSVNVGDETVGVIGAASDQVKEAILQKDEEIILAGLETDGWFARTDFMDWSALLDHLDELPSHYGSPGAVKIQPWVGGTYISATPATPEEIKLWRANANNAFGSLAHNATNSQIAGFFAIRDKIIHLTGYRASVMLAAFARNSGACQAPAIYQGMVVAGALALVLAKSFPGKAGFYHQQFLQCLTWIREGKTIAPAIEQYEEVNG